jgi:hypothetical protein
MDTLIPEYFEYRIKAGDSLSMIMAKFYGVGPRSPNYNKILKEILSINPHIKDPSLIRTGALLRLMAAPDAAPTPATAASPVSNPLSTPFILPSAAMCPAEYGPESFVLNDVPAQDELDFWMLSWLAQNSNYLVIPGSVAAGAQGNLLSSGNIRLIEQISDLYAQYKTGGITQNQYEYRRRLLLNQFKNNVGPFERFLFGNKTTHESIRIARGGGVPATQNIVRHADRLKRLASYGKHGGYVLAGVGVAASCMQIADTDDTHKKNEILVETVASTSVGLIGGALMGIFLVSNPVGWGTALVLAAGSVAVSYAAGVGAKKAYTASGSEVDFVAGTGIDSICR